MPREAEVERPRASMVSAPRPNVLGRMRSGGRPSTLSVVLVVFMMSVVVLAYYAVAFSPSAGFCDDILCHLG